MRIRWALVVVLVALVAPGGCSSSSSGNATPSHTCTLTQPSRSDWHLRTSGTTLRDAQNRVVFLRGVDAGGRSKFAPYMPFEFSSESEFETNLASYMKRAASWGIDSMRVPFTWAALEPTKGSYDAAWLGHYQKLLDAAWAAGIYTVIDFHQDVYSECFCGDGFPCWTIPSPMPPAHDCTMWSQLYSTSGVEKAFDAFWDPSGAVQAEYLAAWDQMLSHFANEPGVVGVEPINEPSPGSANPDTWESTTLPDFMARMIAHVAQKAPTTLVFVDPSGADGVDLSTTMTRPTGNFVFAPHFYPVANPSHTDQVQSLMQFWATLGSKWNVPVWVGEFGMDHGNVNALPWMTAHFAALDALGLSGTEWEYSVETQEWNSETDSIVAADGTEYPVTKAVLRPFARAVAGESVKQSWDPAAGKFTLTFTPASSGVTEISAPARAFPDGMNVTVTGGCYDATSVPGEVMVDGSGASGQLTVTLTSPVALSDGG